MPTPPASSATGDHIEKPLGPAPRVGLMITAALVILLFYLFAAVSVLLLLVSLALGFLVFVALMRFGIGRVVTPFLQRQGTLLMIFVRSCWGRRHTEFQVPLEEADAPELFAFIRQLAQRLDVAPPQRVRLEMNAGAWVLLRGFLRGTGATTLGLGYDLVAGLSERELEAVLAHEMVHAKTVRRGLKRWLVSGLNHAARLTGSLSSLADHHRHAGQNFEFCEWLLRGADPCTRLMARLVSKYSRQDEFEADRGAAEICGSAPLHSSLVKLDLIGAKLSRISWSERVARLQQPEGFSAWLQQELAISAAPFAVVPAGLANPYSSHPSTRDRLAALPPPQEITASSRPAIELIKDPDALAVKLLAEIRRVLSLEEERDHKERQRWLKRSRGSVQTQPLQWLAAFVLVVGAIVGSFAWANGFNPLMLVAAVAIIAGAIWLFRVGRYRDRQALPVPDYETLVAAQERFTDQDELAKQDATLAQEFKAALTGKKKTQKRHLIDESYRALARGDYLRAHVASRLCVQLDGKCVEASLALAVATAAFHQESRTGVFLRTVRERTGFHSPSTQWGAGWALFLLHDWAGAEAFLAAAARRHPDQPTFNALLAICQARRNKYHGAIAHARRALDAQHTPERIELVAELLLDSGYLQEARQLLTESGELVRTKPSLAFLLIRLELLSRNAEAANDRIGELREQGISAEMNLRLGAACENARHDENAAAFFQAALAGGFFPVAHLGLARLATHRKDHATARTHILSALDFSRTPGAPGHGAGASFLQAMGQLFQLYEPIANARAWIVTFRNNVSAGPFAGQSFLIFAAYLKQAEELLKLVLDASLPDKPSLVPEHVEWFEAARDQQPAGVVRPGIQRIWKS